MPKMIVHAPAGTFDAADRQRIAGALTTLGLDCERLPPSPRMRSTVWTYFAEHPADAVFMGGEPAWLPVVTLQVYTLAGGLDAPGRRRLIEGATALLDRRPDGTASAPVCVLVHAMAEADWGMFGGQADLAAMRASAPDAPAI